MQNFYSKSFLLKHCQDILSFYDNRVIDPKGGYFQNYLCSGEVFNPNNRHLVSSCRIAVNYACASSIYKINRYRDIARHGLDYIEKTHWQAEKRAYIWTVENGNATDMKQYAYGYAFVLLAYATALKHGVIGNDDKLYKVFKQLNDYFWLADLGLYGDQLTLPDQLEPYIGQNANMHLCEAMIVAFEATQDEVFIKRAYEIAHNIVVRSTKSTQGVIWEHFDRQLNPDWQYNIEDPKNLYRPWGYQPGHQVEWSKLLLQLYQYKPKAWLLAKAIELFDRSYEAAWDQECGGLVYGLNKEFQWCDNDKYFWVQAEAIAAAARLYRQTDDPVYLIRYHDLWGYCWQHMIDHQHGAWFRILSRENKHFNQEKSIAGAKCDYHNLLACFEVLKLFK